MHDLRTGAPFIWIKSLNKVLIKAHNGSLHLVIVIHDEWRVAGEKLILVNSTVFNHRF